MRTIMHTRVGLYAKRVRFRVTARIMLKLGDKLKVLLARFTPGRCICMWTVNTKGCMVFGTESVVRFG